MATDDEPILDLQTLIERPKIAIDGKRFEILSPDELPLITTQRAAWLGRRLNKLMNAEEKLSAAQQANMADVLDELASIVMEPVPAEVRATLADAQKQAVIEVFTMLSLARKAKLAGAAAAGMAAAHMATPSTTGEPPSPGSSDSMAATPSAG